MIVFIKFHIVWCALPRLAVLLVYCFKPTTHRYFASFQQDTHADRFLLKIIRNYTNNDGQAFKKVVDATGVYSVLVQKPQPSLIYATDCPGLTLFWCDCMCVCCLFQTQEQLLYFSCMHGLWSINIGYKGHYVSCCIRRDNWMLKFYFCCFCFSKIMNMPNVLIVNAVCQKEPAWSVRTSRKLFDNQIGWYALRHVSIQFLGPNSSVNNDGCYCWHLREIGTALWMWAWTSPLSLLKLM